MLHAANIDWSHHEQCDGYGERRRRASSAGASCQPMPLTFLRRGDAAQVVRVRGKGDVHHHLENLGFVEGSEGVRRFQQAGNFIVEIKGASVALDKSVAAKIIVS